jgi:three-Cys-motif partner protein
MARARDIPDDADEKWLYSEHAAAKHEILRRYLDAWLAILGRRRRGSHFRHKQLILIDGFAGRGRYMGGEAGSPAIMFAQAVKAVEAGYAERVVIRCAEPNDTNFAHLREVCADLRHAHVEIVPRQQTFAEIGAAVSDWARRRHPAAPTFVMIDPYGVKGVELSLLRELLNNARLEVLLTLMVRDPARFLKEGNYAEPLTALFGGESWKACEDAPNRAECLLLRFQEAVRPDVAQWATPFRVFEDERKTILYYLVHLTNHDLGMREMKEAMVAKSGEMTFWPVTLRPPDQIALEVAETAPYPTLQQRLAERYEGQTLTFVELLNDDYPDGAWVEKEYRAAIKAMAEAEEPRARIERVEPKTRTGRAARGLKLEDSVRFPGAVE